MILPSCAQPDTNEKEITLPLPGIWGPSDVPFSLLVIKLKDDIG